MLQHCFRRDDCRVDVSHVNCLHLWKSFINMFCDSLQYFTIAATPPAARAIHRPFYPFRGCHRYDGMGRRSHMETTVQQPLPLALKGAAGGAIRRGSRDSRVQVYRRGHWRVCDRQTKDEKGGGVRLHLCKKKSCSCIL